MKVGYASATVFDEPYYITRRFLLHVVSLLGLLFKLEKPFPPPPKLSEVPVLDVKLT